MSRSEAGREQQRTARLLQTALPMLVLEMNKEKLVDLGLTGTLVETIETTVTLGDEDLQLRIDIFLDIADSQRFWFRIWRLEHYRIQSSFPQASGIPSHAPSDELILKEFEGFDLSSEPQNFANASDARSYALRELLQWANRQQPT